MIQTQPFNIIVMDRPLDRQEISERVVKSSLLSPTKHGSFLKEPSVVALLVPNKVHDGRYYLNWGILLSHDVSHHLDYYTVKLDDSSKVINYPTEELISLIGYKPDIPEHWRKPLDPVERLFSTLTPTDTVAYARNKIASKVFDILSDELKALLTLSSLDDKMAVVIEDYYLRLGDKFWGVAEYSRSYYPDTCGWVSNPRDFKRYGRDGVPKDYTSFGIREEEHPHLKNAVPTRLRITMTAEIIED